MPWPGAMEEALAVAGGLDHRSRGPIDLADRDPGAHDGPSRPPAPPARRRGPRPGAACGLPDRQPCGSCRCSTRRARRRSRARRHRRARSSVRSARDAARRAFGPVATIVKSTRSCPCATSSSPRSAAISSSRRPANRSRTTSPSAASAAAAARRSASSSAASLRARSAPTTGRADVHVAPGSARLQRQQVGRPQMRSPSGDPTGSRQPAGDDRVGILPVAPPDDLELPGAGAAGGERPLEHRHERGAGASPGASTSSVARSSGIGSYPIR